MGATAAVAGAVGAAGAVAMGGPARVEVVVMAVVVEPIFICCVVIRGVEILNCCVDVTRGA